MCAPVGSHVFPHRDLHGGTRESCEGRRTNRCCRSAGEGGGMGRGVPRVREEASLDRGRPTTRNGCGSAYPPVGGPDVLHPSCEHGVKGRAGGGRCRESSLFCVDCAGAHHACCAIVAGKGEGSCPASGKGGGLPRRFVRPCDVSASSATTGIRWGHRCEGNGPALVGRSRPRVACPSEHRDVHVVEVVLGEVAAVGHRAPVRVAPAHVPDLLPVDDVHDPEVVGVLPRPLRDRPATVDLLL